MTAQQHWQLGSLIELWIIVLQRDCYAWRDSQLWISSAQPMAGRASYPGLQDNLPRAQDWSEQSWLRKHDKTWRNIDIMKTCHVSQTFPISSTSIVEGLCTSWPCTKCSIEKLLRRASTLAIFCGPNTQERQNRMPSNAVECQYILFHFGGGKFLVIAICEAACGYWIADFGLPGVLTSQLTSPQCKFLEIATFFPRTPGSKVRSRRCFVAAWKRLSTRATRSTSAFPPNTPRAKLPNCLATTLLQPPEKTLGK